jgi:hypothetical protein
MRGVFLSLTFYWDADVIVIVLKSKIYSVSWPMSVSSFVRENILRI